MVIYLIYKLNNQEIKLKKLFALQCEFQMNRKLQIGASTNLVTAFILVSRKFRVWTRTWRVLVSLHLQLDCFLIVRPPTSSHDLSGSFSSAFLFEREMQMNCNRPSLGCFYDGCCSFRSLKNSVRVRTELQTDRCVVMLISLRSLASHSVTNRAVRQPNQVDVLL